MTDLDKSITRRTRVLSPEARPRPIVVTLHPSGMLSLREHGRRMAFEIPLLTCYKYAVRLEADRKRAEKLAKKKARKK